MANLNFSNQYVQIQQVTAENLLTQIDGIIENRLKTFSPPSSTPPTDAEAYLTREQVADMLNVSTVTVWAWANKGILKAYRIGNKVRFLKSEVMQSLTLIPSKRNGGAEE
jgi:excisionase family DNA binding protein